LDEATGRYGYMNVAGICIVLAVLASDVGKTTIKLSISYMKGIIIMRKYLATTIIIAVVTLSFMSIAAGYDVLPNRGLYEVSHERVELRGGFWGRRLKTHHEVTIP